MVKRRHQIAILAMVLGAMTAVALAVWFWGGPPVRLRIRTELRLPPVEPVLVMILKGASADELAAALGQRPTLMHTYRNHLGHSLLGTAAEQGRVDLVKLLLGRGAEVDGPAGPRKDTRHPAR